jgi:predicted SAM-dependent methyltransferase
MKLNIGCGHNKLAGYVNVDHSILCGPDVVVNLEQDWPFADASIDAIVAHHILEHIHDFRRVTQNIYRVLKVGSQVDIRVPHPRSDHFLADPTHVRAIVPGTLEMCSKQSCERYRQNRRANTPLAEQWGVDMALKSTTFLLQEPWRTMFKNKELSTTDMESKINQLNNVCQEIQMVWEKAS